MGITERRQLGSTGLAVSPIGFGGAPLGIRGYLTTEDRASADFEEEGVRAIRLAIDSGINLFDTAPSYGAGRSERIVGRALEGRRDEVVLTTKCGIDVDGNPEKWRADLEASLKRLRTDHVDVLQFHGGYFTDEQKSRMDSSGIVDWALNQKRRGLTRFVGITAENSSPALEALIRTKRFDVLQIAFNIIYQSHCDYSRANEGQLTGVIPLARSLGIGIMTMRTTTSNFLRNLLTKEFSGITAADAARLAIRFALSVKEVDCALVGMTNCELVEANVELATDASLRMDVTALHERFPEGRQAER